jgi:hypothetical protein
MATPSLTRGEPVKEQKDVTHLGVNLNPLEVKFDFRGVLKTVLNDSGLPDGIHIFTPKVEVGGPWNGKCWYIFVYLESFMLIWYIFSVLVCCTKKNLATLLRVRPSKPCLRRNHRKPSKPVACIPGVNFMKNFQSEFTDKTFKRVNYKFEIFVYILIVNPRLLSRLLA